MGTVAADKAAYRFAVIQTLKGQAVLHEGANADGYTIKKILRNRVIISSAEGNRLLALTSGGKDFESSASYKNSAIALSTPEDAERTIRNTAGGRFRSIKLPFDEIMVGLDNIDELIQEVGTSPYRRGKTTGFRIGSVSDDSILERIGLRSHDAIVAINGISLKDQGEAYAFFEKIAQGEKVFIKYRRRNRTRTIEIIPI
jgi:type II secretion system protein C